MKKTVVDINDLQKLSSFFNTTIGRFLGNWFLKIFCVEKVNKVHSRNCHLRGSEFTSALLSDPLIDLKYVVHNKEILGQLPKGAFATISNHPIGSLDGIILIDIFASIRPDFKVMVNGVLENIGAMEDNFISVKPDSKKEGANLQNVNGVRESLSRLRHGSPVGFFPAGAISFYNKKEKRIKDLAWTHSVVKLIKKAKVPICPVFFDFYNTGFFYWLGRIDWRIRTLRIPAEAFNKRGKIADVYIGNLISVEEIQNLDDEDLASYLYEATYNAKNIPQK
ncbi:lysophospholipid acyltransferase family protein [Massilibacteroides sp.]|uniref:lysophospholipid acyltransferase family protein n=1 Tax=Massilibacteroides sp. TaxID=2034766 RepID=UPI002611A039|nr:lysophospholipid acyltransferase family protein [Massilibacteroides sp.]MDD4514145.1 lysophospholipid acyltransferase family protein [Massilibacteroides sp.]